MSLFEEKYAEVILPVPVKDTFTYIVPNEFIEQIAVGKRVVVPFGKRKIYAGIVAGIHNKKPDFESKHIISVLDEKPVVLEKHLTIWKWIAQYYFSSLGEVYKAALPSGLKLESETLIYRTDREYNSEELNAKEEALLNLFSGRKSISLQKAAAEMGVKNIMPTVKLLLNKKLVVSDEYYAQSYKARTEKVILLNPNIYIEKDINDIEKQLKRAPKQLELLYAFLELIDFKAKSIRKKDLLDFSGKSAAVCKQLVDKKILIEEEKEVSRIFDEKQDAVKSYNLSKAQDRCYNEIKNEFENKNKPVLLHGVTGSGKTEVYIKLIEDAISKGQQVLYLLPEIALTAQIIHRLKKNFGDKVGIYHSKYSNNERVEVWQAVLERKYDIVLGVRSSIFLPFPDLGLIIVDEEHESTYKQHDPAPRYHARDLTVLINSLQNTSVLLGTATPSFESYYNANQGKYKLVELLNRFNDIKMPEIKVLNLIKAYKHKKMLSYFTETLFEEIQQAVKNKEQVILFQNRRGFSPFLKCNDCGEIPKCKYCDVSLTYHKYKHQLNCHYCGYGTAVPAKCANCGSTDITTAGFGTEKIEEDLKVLLPQAKVARLDLDTSSTRRKYEAIIDNFSSGQIDILVGTQMVTKGLDFENVSIVGILNADNILFFPDFRAYERSFQLMIQVSGRAGRKKKQGKVFLQTSDIRNIVIEAVRSHDYKGFYNYLIKERQLFKYPPFFRMIKITVKHRNKEHLNAFCNELKHFWKAKFGKRLLGPQEPPISKIQNLYIKQFILKIEKTKSMSLARNYISLGQKHVSQKQGASGLVYTIDVDPV